jgi:hypothetical protein
MLPDSMASGVGHVSSGRWANPSPRLAMPAARSAARLGRTGRVAVDGIDDQGVGGIIQRVVRRNGADHGQHAAASAEDSARSSTAQARLGSSAASGLPRAITPVSKPTPRTNERRSALCRESECVALCVHV